MNTIPLNGAYRAWLEDLKRSVREAQSRAGLSANRELLLLYWNIGTAIAQRQAEDAWGSQVINRISKDLSSEFPEMKGFSPRNLRYMKAFALAWPDPAIWQQVAAKLPWGHHQLLLDSRMEPELMPWYGEAALENSWTRARLRHEIATRLHEREGRATHNFLATMPQERAELASKAFKDPYILDFVELARDAHERHLEAALIERIRSFLLELGKGFAFIGSQVHIEVGGQDYYLDLLFYHTRLHCHIIVDLKLEDFKPEHAGKMNFYLAAVDDLIATTGDEPSIGLLLCRGKNGLVVEYALRDIRSPIAVSTYTVLPATIKQNLPSPDEFKRRLDEVVRSIPDKGEPPAELVEEAMMVKFGHDSRKL